MGELNQKGGENGRGEQVGLIHDRNCQMNSNPNHQL